MTATKSFATTITLTAMPILRSRLRLMRQKGYVDRRYFPVEYVDKYLKREGSEHELKALIKRRVVLRGSGKSGAGVYSLNSTMMRAIDDLINQGTTMVEALTCITKT